MSLREILSQTDALSVSDGNRTLILGVLRLLTSQQSFSLLLVCVVDVSLANSTCVAVSYHPPTPFMYLFSSLLNTMYLFWFKPKPHQQLHTVLYLASTQNNLLTSPLHPGLSSEGSFLMYVMLDRPRVSPPPSPHLFLIL